MFEGVFLIHDEVIYQGTNYLCKQRVDEFEIKAWNMDKMNEQVLNKPEFLKDLTNN